MLNSVESALASIFYTGTDLVHLRVAAEGPVAAAGGFENKFVAAGCNAFGGFNAVGNGLLARKRIFLRFYQCRINGNNIGLWLHFRFHFFIIQTISAPDYQCQS